jgi:FtsH-binding integral membrane protein
MDQQQQSSPRLSAAAIPTHALLTQVLLITAAGMCVSALAAYLFQNVPFGVGLLALLLGFIPLIVLNATRENEPVSLALFYAFAFLEGIGIAPTISAYARSIGPEVVFNAALTTGLGMFALAAIVYATGLDLRRFAGLAMFALLGLILLGIVSIFFRFVHPTVYAWLTLVIFTFYTLIDFARIRAGGDGLTPVQLATQIYLDAINIFLALLRIFGSRRAAD